MTSRSGPTSSWPPELTYLLERHPRSRWAEDGSPSAAFWLQVHGHLRRDCAGLGAAGDDRRAGRTSPAQLAAIAGARLRALVSALHGHHQIEDFHYFPAFRRTEPGLAAGFDRLEAEHAALASEIAAAEAALAELRSAVDAASNNESSAPGIAAERYIAAAERMCARLVTHLNDEEDLVVPLLIEHRDG